MMWKVIHCAESAEKLKEYQEGKFCSDIMRGASVILRIGTEKGGEIPIDKLKGKAPGARYPDKNKVEDYLAKVSASKMPVMPSNGFIDDNLEDVPF